MSLPTGLLLVNTLILLASSLTIEMARRRFARDVALAPVRSIPGVSIGRELRLPLAGRDRRSGDRISLWPGNGLARTHCQRFLFVVRSEQFVCLSAYRGACGSPHGRNSGAALRPGDLFLAPSGGIQAHCGGRDRVVLALHAGFVDLYFRAAGVREIARCYRNRPSLSIGQYPKTALPYIRLAFT